MPARPTAISRPRPRLWSGEGITDLSRLGVVGAIIGGRYVAGDISIAEGVVDRVGLPPGDRGLAIPGFVDVQVNGFGGVNFTTATQDQWREANRLLASTGVSAYLANLISNDVSAIRIAIATAQRVRDRAAPEGAELIGVHLEGPFLSPQKAGIHATEFLRNPAVTLLETWSGSGPVVMTTLAPELPGALPLIEFLVGSKVLVSLGHSDSTGDQAQAGFDAGATSVTHLFNAMSGITARAPGLAGIALSRDDIWLQLILDFQHVDRTLAELVLRFAPHRIVLVTDCLPITATSETRSTLGGTEIELQGDKAVNSNGVLAGSVITMDQALRNALACGMRDIDAVNATSLNPRRLLNPQSEPPLTPGTPADIVIMTDSWEIDAVFRRGTNIAIQGVA